MTMTATYVPAASFTPARTLTAGQTPTATPTVTQAALMMSLAKSVSKPTNYYYDTITYTISYNNYSGSDITNYSVWDSLPAALNQIQYLWSSPGSAIAGSLVYWDSLGTVAAGGGGTLTIAVLATGGGTICNVAQDSTGASSNICAGIMTPTVTFTPTNTAWSPTFTATITATPALSYTTFISIPGGTFTQTDGTNSYSAAVTGFKFGQYLVTYELWYTVYHWAITHGYSFQIPGCEGSAGMAGAAPTSAKYQPAVLMTWRDAIVWCNAYSLMQGLSSAYCSDAGFSIPIISSASGAYSGSINPADGSFDNPYINWSASGYRLATEAEYQYAAGYIDGSSWTPYNYASGDSSPAASSPTIGNFCWDINNSGGNSQPVGLKSPDALDIYDMSGDVMEWCWDWYAAYPSGSQPDYRGPSTGTQRTARSRTYNNDPSLLTISVRANEPPYLSSYSIGMRLVKGE